MQFKGSLNNFNYATRTKAMNRYIPQYMENFGDQETPNDERLFEFLLKTRYLNHWEQEKEEYYFSVNWVWLISQFANKGFITQEVISYRNEHVISEIEDRFDYDSKYNLKEITNTHIKIIFKDFDM